MFPGIGFEAPKATLTLDPGQHTPLLIYSELEGCLVLHGLGHFSLLPCVISPSGLENSRLMDVVCYPQNSVLEVSLDLNERVECIVHKTTLW